MCVEKCGEAATYRSELAGMVGSMDTMASSAVSREMVVFLEDTLRQCPHARGDNRMGTGAGSAPGHGPAFVHTQVAVRNPQRSVHSEGSHGRGGASPRKHLRQGSGVSPQPLIPGASGRAVWPRPRYLSLCGLRVCALGVTPESRGVLKNCVYFLAQSSKTPQAAGCFCSYKLLFVAIPEGSSACPSLPVTLLRSCPRPRPGSQLRS